MHSTADGTPDIRRCSSPRSQEGDPSITVRGRGRAREGGREKGAGRRGERERGRRKRNGIGGGREEGARRGERWREGGGMVAEKEGGERNRRGEG